MALVCKKQYHWNKQANSQSLEILSTNDDLVKIVSADFIPFKIMSTHLLSTCLGKFPDLMTSSDQ